MDSKLKIKVFITRNSEACKKWIKEKENSYILLKMCLCWILNLVKDTVESIFCEVNTFHKTVPLNHWGQSCVDNVV